MFRVIAIQSKRVFLMTAKRTEPKCSILCSSCDPELETAFKLKENTMLNHSPRLWLPNNTVPKTPQYLEAELPTALIKLFYELYNILSSSIHQDIPVIKSMWETKYCLQKHKTSISTVLEFPVQVIMWKTVSKGCKID